MDAYPLDLELVVRLVDEAVTTPLATLGYNRCGPGWEEDGGIFVIAYEARDERARSRFSPDGSETGDEIRIEVDSATGDLIFDAWCVDPLAQVASRVRRGRVGHPFREDLQHRLGLLAEALTGLAQQPPPFTGSSQQST